MTSFMNGLKGNDPEVCLDLHTTGDFNTQDIIKYLQFINPLKIVGESIPFFTHYLKIPVEIARMLFLGTSMETL